MMMPSSIKHLNEVDECVCLPKSWLWVGDIHNSIQNNFVTDCYDENHP